MTRRVLTTIGSAAAVATAVGTCLLLAPTPQAQADICSGTNCVIFGPTGITAKSGTGTSAKSASVTWLPSGICAIATDGMTTQQSPGCS